ncbi:hypothetical protein PF002_g28684 [Phytophthora fragariae]|uniref:Uncharacterized protein n=1 Tax=Phytophthora fragariae TaxID=53985 RepID=A0A6A3VYD9_9STRA|nr:hypothetical protein PF002_g28684 [Phytophthora fragariae]
MQRATKTGRYVLEFEVERVGRRPDEVGKLWINQHDYEQLWREGRMRSSADTTSDSEESNDGGRRSIEDEIDAVAAARRDAVVPQAVADEVRDASMLAGVSGEQTESRRRRKEAAARTAKTCAAKADKGGEDSANGGEDSADSGVDDSGSGGEEDQGAGTDGSAVRVDPPHDEDPAVEDRKTAKGRCRRDDQDCRTAEGQGRRKGDAERATSGSERP